MPPHSVSSAMLSLATEDSTTDQDLLSGLVAPAAFPDVPENRKQRRARARGQRQSVPPLRERLRTLERTRFEYFLEHRLAKIVLPPWFEADALLARFEEIDGLPAHRDLARRIDEDTLRLEDLAGSGNQREPSSDLIRQGAANLRKETRILRSRFQFLSEQRRRKQLWVVQCMLQGDVPAALAKETIRSFLWEITEMEACQAQVIPRAEESARGARSRREQDQCVREMRADVNALAILADRALDARESFALTLDLWNSPTVGGVGTTKPWKIAPFGPESLTSGLLELRESTAALMRELTRRFETESPGALFNLGADLAPLGRSLFDTPAEGPLA